VNYQLEMVAIAQYIAGLSIVQKVEALNYCRGALHSVSPFASEPVDFVQWIPNDLVTANDYNPNTVAPPEMKLLAHSIQQDGYTQPIVSWYRDSEYEVVDGFHRHRVGKENEDVIKRVKGYLPLVTINAEREDKGDRIAATIRHNRARGKHKVEGMSDIVIELKRRNWSDEKICKHLGMDQDEVLRLCQITGLAELFSDQDFSKSWDVEGQVTADDFKELTDDSEGYADVVDEFRTVNTNDGARIFHTHDKWECFKAGFYNNFPPKGMSKQQCEELYRDFLADLPRFSAAANHIVTEWKHSCEHYLTNHAMNRIAWIGQASMCYETGIPSAFRSGFFLLSEEQQNAANNVALVALNKWLTDNGREAVTMAEALGDGRQADIY
jgi:hypothetical protein